MLHTRVPFATLLCLTLLVPACGRSDDANALDVAVTDSLGVALHTFPHTEADLERWSVDPDPTLHVGALEGAAPDVFGRISSLWITPDGGVVVTDELAGEIRRFSATGAHVSSSGGLGEGPGEFSNSMVLLRVSGDSTWTWDQRQQRVSLFAADGFVTSRTTPGELLLSRTALIDSRLFGQSNARLTGMPETGMGRPPVRFAVVHEDGEPEILFETAGHERFLDIRLDNGAISAVNVFQPPFARGSFFGVIRSGSNVRIIGGPNDRLVLGEWNDDGALRASYRYPGLDRPVTDAVIEEARRRIMDQYDEPTAQMRQELAMVDSDIPDHLPAFDRIRDDDESRLWVRRPGRDDVEEWLVLASEDLTPLARIVLPAGFALFDVRGGRLGGRWLDDLGVSYARIHTLRDGR